MITSRSAEHRVSRGTCRWRPFAATALAAAGMIFPTANNWLHLYRVTRHDGEVQSRALTALFSEPAPSHSYEGAAGRPPPSFDDALFAAPPRPPSSEEAKLDSLHIANTPLEPDRFPPVAVASLRPHPHAGATDERGRYNYRHDPTFLRARPPPPVKLSTEVAGDGRDHGGGGDDDGSGGRRGRPRLYDLCAIPAGEGEEGPEGYRALAKIRRGLQRRRPEDEREARTRVLCIVHTYSGRHDQIRTIARTWGKRCDGFLAASNRTDRLIGAVDVLHRGEESYANMWQKVRSIWSYVHDHYLDEYDLFHIGGDDMYVLPENLRRYRASMMNLTTINMTPSDEAGTTEPPLYLGGSIVFGSTGKNRFCGGGAGYTLNRPALSLLITQLLPSCGDKTRGGTRSSKEDIIISRCFRPRGVLCHNTLDEGGAMRYHVLDAQHAATDRHLPMLLMKEHGFRFGQPGLDRVSETSISFHLTVKGSALRERTRDNPFGDNGMRRYDAILYELCGDKL